MIKKCPFISKILTIVFLFSSLAITLATSSGKDSDQSQMLRTQSVSTYFQMIGSCSGPFHDRYSLLKLHVQYIRTDCSIYDSNKTEVLPEVCAHPTRIIPRDYMPSFLGEFREYIDYSHPSIIAVLTEQGNNLNANEVMSDFEAQMGFKIEELFKYLQVRSVIGGKTGASCMMQNTEYLLFSQDSNSPIYQSNTYIYDGRKQSLRKDQFVCTKPTEVNDCGFVVQESIN